MIVNMIIKTISEYIRYITYIYIYSIYIYTVYIYIYSIYIHTYSIYTYSIPDVHIYTAYIQHIYMCVYIFRMVVSVVKHRPIARGADLFLG